MKTLVIRIGEASDASSDYPVELLFDDGRQDWRTQSTAQGRLPKTLMLEDGPLPPPALNTLPDPNTTPEAVFEKIGEYIHLLLDRSGIGATWRELRKRPERIRTILDVRPVELEVVPWEIMRDNARRLFASDAHPLALGTIDFERPTPTPEWPIRVLVVVGCDPDDPDIEWRKELHEVETALRDLRHTVDYEVLRQPSLTMLRDQVAAFRPHVFHFIGHGGIDEESGRPALELWDETSKGANPWKADDIHSVFSACAPRFTFLNACRSSTEEAANWNLSRAFLDAGAVAVLGMRGDVRDKAAAVIAKRVYSDLALGRPLDLAVAAARVDITTITGIERHWTLPRLVLTVPPERVLPLDLGLSGEAYRQIIEATDFADLHDFVDRRLERRSLWQKVEPTSKNKRNLVIVRGDDDVGKTALLRWCLQGHALRDRRVRYVDLDGQESHGFLSFLHRLRGDEGDDTSSPIREPLPEPAFRRFLFELNHLLDGKEPPASDLPLTGPVDIDPTRRLQRGAENSIPRIFLSFRNALEQAAKDEPLLIVIDHLRWVFREDFKKYIKPLLLKPIMEGRVRNVRVVVAVRESDFEDFDLDSLVPGHAANEHVVRVLAFRPEEFLDLAREFCRYNNFGEQTNLLAAYGSQLTDSWKPRTLRIVQQLLKPLRTAR
ncbi:CHAT domain-containing protein [Sorangium sp. So ce1153]|uniref:CHAT domain-containing protein n=1 Tax=Sorangium sp. So ce1153 TaxID=3133333 RepID=UPI003F60108A